MNRDARIVNSGTAAPQTMCAVCGSRDLSVFWEAEQLPIFCNVLCATREEARGIPRGDVCLSFCKGCALITNRAFDPARMAYDVTYENSPHFSPRFQTYAEALAARLVKRYDLRNKTILEIACGQGVFLRLLCDLGCNRGLGFDPSYVPKACDDPGIERISFVQDYYGERYADRRADFICCRHALEHIADPLRFLRGLRRNIGLHSDTIVFFEVPNSLYSLRDMGIWDLIYEHCTYFVPASLKRCFEAAGFEALHLTDEYGGQFVSIEARPRREGLPAPPADDAALAGVTQDGRAFAARYVEKVQAWRERIEEMRRAGARAVVWGSGSKGVTFLNILRAEDRIKYVVDINPRKQGMFVAGTGQHIVAPEFLREYQPDSVIVMNAVYLEEIRATARQMGLRAEFLVA